MKKELKQIKIFTLNASNDRFLLESNVNHWINENSNKIKVLNIFSNGFGDVIILYSAHYNN